MLSAILPIVVAFSRATTDSGVSIAVNIVSWIVFIVDLLVHMRYIRHYLRTGTGVFDLVVVILTAPWFLIPGLEGTQFLQLARLARLLRIIAVSPSGEADRDSGWARSASSPWACCSSRRGRPTSQSTRRTRGSRPTATHCGGASSRSPRWGTETSCPQTTTGRVAGVFLMLTGVATLGIISGTLASFFKSAREERRAVPA